MTGILGMIPGLGQIKTGALAIGAALTFAGGVATAEAYEHWVPWGSAAKLHRLRDSLPARDAERYSAGAHAQFLQDEGIVQKQWVPALAQCRADQRGASVDAAAALDREAEARRSASSAAFRLGRASCPARGTADGKNSSTAPGSAGTGVVRPEDDLRNIVAGSIGTAL